MRLIRVVKQRGCARRRRGYMHDYRRNRGRDAKAKADANLAPGLVTRQRYMICHGRISARASKAPRFPDGVGPRPPWMCIARFQRTLSRLRIWPPGWPTPRFIHAVLPALAYCSRGVYCHPRRWPMNIVPAHSPCCMPMPQRLYLAGTVQTWRQPCSLILLTAKRFTKKY